MDQTASGHAAQHWSPSLQLRAAAQALAGGEGEHLLVCVKKPNSLGVGVRRALEVDVPSLFCHTGPTCCAFSENPTFLAQNSRPQVEPRGRVDHAPLFVRGAEPWRRSAALLGRAPPQDHRSDARPTSNWISCSPC